MKGPLPIPLPKITAIVRCCPRSFI